MLITYVILGVYLVGLYLGTVLASNPEFDNHSVIGKILSTWLWPLGLALVVITAPFIGKLRKMQVKK